MASIAKDYCAGEERVRKFFGQSGHAAFSGLAEDARARASIVDPQVVENLRRSSGPLSSEQLSHLSALERGAVAVVAGQQIGLFGGPLFTLYKAATAVRLAAEISASGTKAVPIFWLQTEDHDVDEVDHTWLWARDAGAVRVGLDRSAPTAIGPISLAQAILGPSVRDALDDARGALGHLRFGPKVIQRLTEHWQPGALWWKAFQSTLHDWFGEAGLLFLQPRDETLAALAAPLYEQALAEWRSVAQSLTDNAESLQGLGYSPQVHIRPDSPLFFVHPDGPQGPRYRIRADGEGAFRVLGDGRSVRESEIARWIRDEPLRVSSSALLRPLIQDVLLPAVATVAGPGEIAYAAQLGPLYRAFGAKRSVFVPRWSARVLPRSVLSALNKLGLTAAAAERDASLLARERAEALPHPAPVWSADIASTLDSTMRAWVALHPDLARAQARTLGTMRAAAQRFDERASRAAVAKHDAWTHRVKRAQNALWPAGAPQERRIAAPSFQALCGAENFVARVMDAAQPTWGEPYEWVIDDTAIDETVFAHTERA